jgi:hypothetical protein
MFGSLRAAAGGALGGTITGTQIEWADGITVKIDRRLGRAWFVFEPCVWLDRPGSDNEDVEGDTALDEPDEEWAVAKEFVRERAARRYNYVLGNLLDGWLDVLVGVGKDKAELRTFGIGDGIDASFTLSRTTAFSGRGGT